MSDVPPPNLDHANSRWLRRGFALFGRGVVYALAFWFVYALLYRPPWFVASPSDKEDRRNDAYWKSYDEQMARAEKAWGTSELQQRRMDGILTKQEELTRRFEGVIANWENQSKSKR